MLPVVLLNERIYSAGGVVVARGVTKERIDSSGGVEAADAVAKERILPDGGVELPVVLL